METVITFDFETYYDTDYSLSKMSVEEYCKDPRFEILMVGTRVDGEPVKVFADAATSLRDIHKQYPKAIWLAHNCHFDGYILEQVLNIHPWKMSCTLLLSGYTGWAQKYGRSLAALAPLVSQAKGDYLLQTKGLRFNDFTSDEIKQFARYCERDVDITYRLFFSIIPFISEDIRDFVDMTIRMYTMPILELDVNLLEKYKQDKLLEQEQARLELQRLFNFESVESFLKALRSTASFSKMLSSLGVEIPMKFSEARHKKFEVTKGLARALVDKTEPLTKEETRQLGSYLKVLKDGTSIPALAKNDDAFIELMNSDDESVSLLCNLRAENNSNLGASRADALMAIAQRGSRLSVPLTAWGAHTGRYTAGTGSHKSSDRINLQNMPKRNRDVSLRKAIKAPEGYKLIAGDSAQIEARVGAWIAGQYDLVELFQRGEDPYVDMASYIYGVPASEIQDKAKVQKDPEYVQMRMVGKVTMLSSQYGIGGNKFSSYLLRNGIKLDPDPEEHLSQARYINKLYNDKYAFIKGFRSQCDNLLYSFLNGTNPLTFTQVPLKLPENYGKGSQAWLEFPSRYKLLYQGLKSNYDDKTAKGYLSYESWEHGKRVTKKIYGGMLFNNIVQGLSFELLWNQGVRINRKYKVVSNVHDSWISIVPESQVDEAKKYIMECLLWTPTWAKTIPLGAEVIVGDTYEVA
ncbi:MAG: hypothetical protein LBS60_08760 [Deltaproteobacteria bacterium]|jgi:DNA polymerase|nr:hypothetical protein [Deltaproteobacteria bacterium]